MKSDIKALTFIRNCKIEIPVSVDNLGLSFTPLIKKQTQQSRSEKVNYTSVTSASKERQADRL